MPLFSPLIVNTDTDNGQGQHWITCVRFGDDDLFVFDPLSENNERADSNGRNIDKYFSGYNTHFYKYPAQMEHRESCGYFALYVAQLLKKNKRLAKVRDFPKSATAAIVKEFGKSADNGDEARVFAAFGR